jgi:hypothetical protein
MKPVTKFVVAILASCCVDGCHQLSPPTPPHTYPTSSLDGTPMYPCSWHKAHVRRNGDDGPSGDFILDDGTAVHLFFGGGSGPWTLPSMPGTLYVEVPSFEHDDEDNSYNFEKFVPDRAAQTKTHAYSKRSLMTTGDQSPALTGSGNTVIHGSQQ